MSESFIAGNLVHSGLYRVSQDWSPLRAGASDLVALPPAESALALAPLSAPGGNLALILVESWGHMSAGMEDFVLAPVLAAAALKGYRIQRGLVASQGATTAAELRELCGGTASYLALNADLLRNCRPWAMAREGRTTFGVHGFNRSMFNRSSWWPQAGIRDAYFLGTPGWEPAPDLCGTSFRGACDRDALRFFGEQLRRGPQQFGYLLTLSSHLPLGPEVDKSGFCDRAYPRMPAGPCKLLASHRQLFDAIADEILLRDGTADQIVIVGDHPPPFFSRADNNMYDAGKVPYLILTR